jgi:hypothetical protein
MKLFQQAKDGGPDSTVSGFFFIELKQFFSVALLRFMEGSREAYHDHAFNSISWILSGTLVEHHKNGEVVFHTRTFTPIKTLRNTFHKVYSRGTTWVFTIRGPWVDRWHEFLPQTQQQLTLTHGRVVVSQGGLYE